jgi:hypothetical protein
MIKETKRLLQYRRRPALPTRARRALVNCQRIALMRAKAIQSSTKPATK